MQILGEKFGESAISRNGADDFTLLDYFFVDIPIRWSIPKPRTRDEFKLKLGRCIYDPLKMTHELLRKSPEIG